MAFSTQKEFFHVPFMNEDVEYECRRACVKLKSYGSTVDDRSWAMDETLQSRFLSDLVTCQTPVGYMDEDGDFDDFGGTDDSGYSGGGVGDGVHEPAGGRVRRFRGRGPPSAHEGFVAGAGSGAPLGSGKGAGSGLGSGKSAASSFGVGKSAASSFGGGKSADSSFGAGKGAGSGAPLGSGKSAGSGAPLGSGKSAGSSFGAGKGAGSGAPLGSSKGSSYGPGKGGTGFGAGKGGDTDGGVGEAFLAMSGGLVNADSVLTCANQNLGKLQEMLLRKEDLEKQLEVSNERLKVANLENDKIKAIMNEKFDSNHSKDFYNKIQKLASSGKISKGEENELLQIYNKFEDMGKAYEVLQAENAYLKLIIEKLSLRASYDGIKVDDETSTDVSFLQKQVNSLRKEVAILRNIEDEKLNRQFGSGRGKISDQDAENLKAIIKERNALRDKCKTFKDLEKRVHDLQKKAKEADQMSGSLSSNLDSQTKYIGEMEHEMQQMQNYYEDQLTKMKFNEELLKCQLDEMKEDLIRAKCDAQKVECLQMEIGCLRNELIRRDVALSDYDCQYKQLMSVIDELQANSIQNLHDTQTQTCTDYIDDLAFFARATLNEIKKELSKRGADGDKIGGSFTQTINSGAEECCAEMERLRKTVDRLTEEQAKMERDFKKQAEEMCADALNRLKEMENELNNAKMEITNLKEEKDQMSVKAIDKLNEFSERVQKMDVDMDKTSKDTDDISKGLNESIKLVKDISDVQMKNQQLANAVSAINSRDDEKIIDDLRRQLLEEQMKNKKCVQENENLRSVLRQRGIDPDAAAQGIIKEIEGQKVKSEVDVTGDSKSAKASGAELTKASAAELPKAGDAESTKSGDVGLTKSGDVGSTKSGDVGSTKSDVADATKSGGPSASAKSGEVVTAKRDDADESKEPPFDYSSLKYNYSSSIASGGTLQKKLDPGSVKPSATTIDENLKETGGGPGKSADKLKDADSSAKKESPVSDNLRGGDAVDSTDNKQIEESGPPQKASDGSGIGGSPEGTGIGKDPQSDDGKGPQSVGGKGPQSEGGKGPQSGGVKGPQSGGGGKGPQSGGRKSPPSGGGKGHKDDAKRTDGQGEGDPFQQFIDLNATAMMKNITAGAALEKELRGILNAFMQECGFCFCKSVIPKSKFYALCHKLLHHGIHCMSFRELAYLHRKVFMAAEKLHPGCLLNMILTEQGLKDADGLKCCYCKNALCCSNSEEMLKEKVCKLERDIEMAKEYLDSLKTQPASPKTPYTRGKTFRPLVEELPETVDDLLTCREAKIPTKCSSKQIKSLKARILKCSELLR